MPSTGEKSASDTATVTASNLEQSVAHMAELAGGLAHELRNPLSTMMINLKLLGEDLQDRTIEHEAARRRSLIRVDTLRREAERLQALFDDFLRLAGPFRLQLSVVNLGAIVAELADFFLPQAESHGLELGVSVPVEAVYCSADENLMRQALLNLLINAQQSTTAGGTISLDCRRDGGDLLISVADTGHGISLENQARLFRPFFSTRPNGTGLGLPIVLRIVLEHGGDLSFTSTVGQGTTFYMRLPTCAPPTQNIYE
jgi:signal transduction histidine kinase